MKAIYLKQKGAASKAFEMRETQIPQMKEPEDVLIKVEAFGLNYADVMARHGQYREAPPMPCIIGYEVVGTVEKVQSKANEHLIGKRVVGFTRFGGYAEYAISKDYGLTEIDSLDAGIALCIATQYVTAYYMAYVATNLFAGDKVLIHAGAGGVGTALIQLCKLKGCTIFATAGSDKKIEYVKNQGADHGINYKAEDYVDSITNVIHDNRIDVTFNPIAGSTFKKDFSLVGSGGRVILFGGSELSGKRWGVLSGLNFVRKMGFRLAIGLMMRSKSIIGVNMLKIGDNKPSVLHHCLVEVTKLIQEGVLSPHVGATYHATELAEAHTLLESRQSIGKVIVKW
jgi:NADPH:quinone reductase-like Zn-dependent oxidoreductase